PPIFQVFFALEAEPLPDSSAAGLSFTACEIDSQTSKFDLSLQLVKNPGGFSGWIEYSTALFDSSRICRLADHFHTLLKSALSEPDRPISGLELLPEHEGRKLMAEWTSTQRDYPRDKTLVDLFREQTLRTPNAEALVCGAVRLSYSVLYTRAAQIAGRLIELGVTSESLVGICLPRCPDMVAAILGTLMAQGAYVPLDPKYPKERLSFIAQDAMLKVLLTQSHLLESLPEADSLVVCLDKLDVPQTDPTREPTYPGPRATDLAYVIY